MRYFIYTARVPIVNGNVESQGVVSCDVFINKKTFEKQMSEIIKAENPQLTLLGKPLITFLHEINEDEKNAWIQNDTPDHQTPNP